MDYYRHARKEIFPYLPENCDRLLEIGCGSGCTVKAIKQFKEVNFSYGVELSKEAANEAQKAFDNVFQGPVEAFDFSKFEAPEKQFQVRSRPEIG
ncbi:MAG: cyclopropane fatty-acyl-phospholipid synthase-like methyltransferase [Alphaproteobacteria bacterium]|jgi:cyclopropane fatty-acyl-phospholipid synthase-like methyltransferase